MNKRERNRCLKRRRKKAVYRWKAVRKNRQREKRQEKDKKRAFGGSDAYICLYLSGDGLGKGLAVWKPHSRNPYRQPARIHRNPSLYEEEFRREKENASRTEQGISLFLKEGRIVFFSDSRGSL